MRERPSLPADVTVSELLYMLAIRAPRQVESEGGERRERRSGGRERSNDKLKMREEGRVIRKNTLKERGRKGGCKGGKVKIREREEKSGEHVGRGRRRRVRWQINEL